MAVAADRTRSRRQVELTRLLRYGAPALYVAVLVFVVYRDGIPAARERLLMWIVLGLLAFSITNVRGWARGGDAVAVDDEREDGDVERRRSVAEQPRQLELPA